MFVDVKTGPLERDFERLGVRVRVTPRGGWRWSGEIDAMVEYGVRHVASAWEDDYVEHLRGEGFSRGRSASTVMSHEERGIW